MLLSLQGILLCRICPMKPSEQVFLPRSHLGTLPNPIPTLGFWAGRRLENQGPFSSAMTRFLASRSMAKAD